MRWSLIYHNERDDVSNHQPYACLLNRLFRRRSKKISKLRVTGLCAGNSPVTGQFPIQMASNAEMCPFDDVTMWWCCSRWRTNTCEPWCGQCRSWFPTWMLILRSWLISRNTAYSPLVSLTLFRCVIHNNTRASKRYVMDKLSTSLAFCRVTKQSCCLLHVFQMSQSSYWFCVMQQNHCLFQVKYKSHRSIDMVLFYINTWWHMSVEPKVLISMYNAVDERYGYLVNPMKIK